ncbi:MAG: hypothetical protein KC503_47340 [Myxococcales bacterium]|nr:hypothetical protein [Myxococcales bacterium]
MTKQLRFDDHGAFHKQVLRVTLAGAALGLIGHITALIINPRASVAVSLAQLAITAAALAFAAKPFKRSELFSTLPLGLGLALLGTLCMHALSTATHAYPWFGLGVYGLTVGIIAGRDLKGYQRFALPLATALTMVLATWVDRTFAARLPLTDYVPGFVAAPLRGAVFGFLVSIGLVVRQLRLARDPVLVEYDRIKDDLAGEMGELTAGAIVTYERINEALRDRSANRSADEPELTRGVETLMLKVLALGKRWQEVEREASRTSAAALSGRVDELDAKVAAATDPVARRQYEMARDALRSQLKYVTGIATSRERVLARVHGYLAVLERVHLAVLNHQGADTAKFSDELSPLLESIDDMGAEMDIASAALAEVAEVTLGESIPTAPTDAPLEGPPTRAEMKAQHKRAAEEIAPTSSEDKIPAEGSNDGEAELMKSAFN